MWLESRARLCILCKCIYFPSVTPRASFVFATLDRGHSSSLTPIPSIYVFIFQISKANVITTLILNTCNNITDNIFLKMCKPQLHSRYFRNKLSNRELYTQLNG
uniref:Uncharacterized protein n=1 Tax=Cacopsylla melanoneura TaxID=428564 RepID=A0A8D8Z739_9HEMI